MTKKEKLHYCKGILARNVFNENEFEDYIGATDKKPHGIEQKYWKQAYYSVGINISGKPNNFNRINTKS